MAKLSFQEHSHGIPGTCDCWKINHERHGLCEHQCGSFVSLNDICVFEMVFSGRHSSMLHNSNYARLGQEHITQFQVTCWSSNSTDFQPAKYISGVILRQHNAIKPFLIFRVCMIIAWTNNMCYSWKKTVISCFAGQMLANMF